MLCRSSGEQRELACNHRHTCFSRRHPLLLSAKKRICLAGSTLSSDRNSCSWRWQRQLVIHLVGISLLGHRSPWSFLYWSSFGDRCPGLFLLIQRPFGEYLTLAGAGIPVVSKTLVPSSVHLCHQARAFVSTVPRISNSSWSRYTCLFRDSSSISNSSLSS